MKYLSLFGLRIRHDYHPGGACHDLDVVPTAKTRRLMERHRLRLQPQPDGLAVAAASDAAGPMIAPPLGEVFEFELGLRNAAFPHFTDLQAQAGMGVPVYRNLQGFGLALQLADAALWQTQSWVSPAQARQATFVLAGNPLPLDGSLSSQAQAADFQLIGASPAQRVTGYDASTKRLTIAPVRAQQRVTVRYRLRPPLDRSRLAAVQLRYDASMPAPGRADAPFEIRFQARAARWAYYLVTDRAGDFQVVDTGRAGPPLRFSAANRTVLDDAASVTDRCAHDLARQYPAQTRIRFLSDQPVPCTSAARKGLELRLAGDTVMAALLNPSVRQASRIRRQAGSQVPDEDVFHQVIHDLTSH